MRGQRKFPPKSSGRTWSNARSLALSQRGGRMELLYATGGVIQGTVNATPGSLPGVPYIAAIDGVWNIDDSGRICASMVLGRTLLPFRCQYWFKYKDDYFIADSEDRSAKILRRNVKQ